MRLAVLIALLAPAIWAADYRDPFIDLAESFQPDLEIRPVINDGKHALEADFLTEESPIAILEAYRKTFDGQGMRHRLVAPTEARPFGSYVVWIGGEMKRVSVMPAHEDGLTFCRITSYHNDPVLAQQLPPLQSVYPEIGELGAAVSFSRETLKEGRRQGTFILAAEQPLKPAFERARLVLTRAGWTDRGVSEGEAGKKRRVCLLTKAGASAALVAKEEAHATKLMLTLSAP